MSQMSAKPAATKPAENLLYSLIMVTSSGMAQCNLKEIISSWRLSWKGKRKIYHMSNVLIVWGVGCSKDWLLLCLNTSANREGHNVGGCRKQGQQFGVACTHLP